MAGRQWCGAGLVFGRLLMFKNTGKSMKTGPGTHSPSSLCQFWIIALCFVLPIPVFLYLSLFFWGRGGKKVSNVLAGGKQGQTEEQGKCSTAPVHHHSLFFFFF